MSREIIIDFTNIDIKSLQETEQILHEDSYNEVIILLKEDLDIKIKDSMEFEDFHRTHNAIFIEGGRGSGKTQFLLNLKRVEYTSRFKNDEKVKQLYFIGPIDPTILHDNESFLTIVLARILNQIEPQLKRVEEDKKKHFYELLKSISFAIDGVINKKNSNKTALEHIAQDQSSLKLESYLHDFFKEVSKIVGNRRLVLLIDDIDMAFDKGFEILEVIRKYLSSPYLVPILTGDKWLYEDILEKHFFKQLKNKYFTNKYYKQTFDSQHYKRDMIKELQKDYLTKVLPQHRRITLQNLFQLAEKNTLFFNCNKNSFSFQQKSLEGFFYKRAKDIYKTDTDMNKFIEELFSNSLRKITQLLHGEYLYSHNEEKQFNLINIESIKVLKKKYSLNHISTDEEYVYIFNKGQEEFAKGEFSKALENFEESYKLYESTETLLQIGNCYFASSNHKKSNKIFQKVIKSDLKNPHAHYKLGYGFAYLDQYQESIKSYKKVLEIIPDSANTYNSLGLSQVALNQYDKALDSYKKAITLKDNYYKPYINILEIGLIQDQFYMEHKKEIDKLEQEFNDKFQDNKIALKYYGMLKLLKKIDKNSLKTDIYFENWQKKYKDTIVGDWDFKVIKRWVESIEDQQKKEHLLEAIEKFKETM